MTPGIRDHSPLLVLYPQRSGVALCGISELLA